jgi:hypothetical protein
MGISGWVFEWRSSVWVATGPEPSGLGRGGDSHLRVGAGGEKTDQIDLSIVPDSAARLLPLARMLLFVVNIFLACPN